MNLKFYTISVLAHDKYGRDRVVKKYDVLFSNDFGWYITDDFYPRNKIDYCETYEDALTHAAMVKNFKFPDMIVVTVMIETHTVSTTSQVV
jgi:hypothetical protein